MIKQITCFLLLLIGTIKVSAQYYDIGQEPASIKWRQIKTANFRIVFPQSFEKRAPKIAGLFEQMRLPVASSLKVNPSFTPVLIHTGNVTSNAYSIWTPRRLELLVTPPQDIYGHEWLNQLVIHEYRHVVQLSKLDQGFTRFLGILLGQQAVPMITGLFVPPWFLEGDAVATETALSQTGRGRVAAFSMPLRAQIIDKKPFHYTKAVLGSYKDFVPDHYITGYHLVAAARMKYGVKVWNSALDRTGKYPYTLNPFSKGIKEITGLKKRGLYDETVIVLDSLWRKKDEFYNVIPEASGEGYNNYIQPYHFRDGILALKKSLDKIPRFVFIDSSGREYKLHEPGYMVDENVSFNGKYLSWSEKRSHVRWENQSTTDIMCLHVSDNRLIRIKTGKMMFAPHVSPSNDLIAAVHVLADGQYSLALLNVKGEIISEFSAPENMFIAMPSWSPDGKSIVCILVGKEGKQLAELNLESGDFTKLTPVTYDEILYPRHLGDRIIFNKDIDGRSEICQIELSTGRTIQLTSSRFGTTQASATDRGIITSVYTANGYKPVNLYTEKFLNKQIDFNRDNKWTLADVLQSQEQGSHDTINQVMLSVPEVTDYSKAKNLINVHSWAPVYIDIDDQSLRPGVSVMSQNLLSSLFITGGYDYNLDEETGQYKASVQWKGWFPEISSTISTGLRTGYTGHVDSAIRFNWQETSWDVGIGQWLLFPLGKFTSGLFFQVKHQLTNLSHTESTPSSFKKGVFAALDYRIYNYFLQKQAHRDIATRYGYTLDFHYKHTPYGDFIAGAMFSIQSKLYFPGIFANSSFQVYTAYQKLNVSNDGYRFSGDFGILAAYNAQTPGELFRIRPSYSLPLAYPDLNLGTFLYLKRIRTSAFYDFSWAKHQKWNTFPGAGIDIVADFHLFALPAPISAGIRTVYVDKKKDLSASLLFSVNLYEY